MTTAKIISITRLDNLWKRQFNWFYARYALHDWTRPLPLDDVIFNRKTGGRSPDMAFCFKFIILPQLIDTKPWTSTHSWFSYFRYKFHNLYWSIFAIAPIFKWHWYKFLLRNTTTVLSKCEYNYISIFH